MISQRFLKVIIKMLQKIRPNTLGINEKIDSVVNKERTKWKF